MDGVAGNGSGLDGSTGHRHGKLCRSHRDGLFLPAAASIHPRFGTPALAIALQALLALVLVALGSFNEIISYFIFVVVIFIALTVAALFVLRHKQSNSLAYLTPGYPVTPIVFLLLVVLLLFLLGMNHPKQSLLGVGVVALGIRRTTFGLAVKVPTA